MSTMAQNTKIQKSTKVIHSFHDNWSRDFWCPWKEYFTDTNTKIRWKLSVYKTIEIVLTET